MTYIQIIVFMLIIIVGIVWIISVLSRPVSVENKESIEKSILTAMAMVNKHGGAVRITYVKSGITISYLPEEDEDDESVQDGD